MPAPTKAELLKPRFFIRQICAPTLPFSTPETCHDPPRFKRTCSNGVGLACGEQKITLGEMRASGPRRLLVYCGDCKCAHSLVIDAKRWSDAVRLSDLEPKFTCQACGHRGADVGPFFGGAPEYL
jgi:hypothetical protein